MGEAKNRGTFEQRKAQAVKEIQVGPQDLTEIKCELCGNTLFLELKILRKLSSLSPKNPSGKDQLLMFNVFKCAKTDCNWVCDAEGKAIQTGKENIND